MGTGQGGSLRTSTNWKASKVSCLEQDCLASFSFLVVFLKALIKVPHLCPLFGGGTSFSQHIHVEHTHTHSPMVTSMVTVVIQKAFKEVELENLLLHLETCLQSSLSFISVTERGFMLFTQRSVNTVGIVVCLHSPNTTVHTYFCCL